MSTPGAPLLQVDAWSLAALRLSIRFNNMEIAVGSGSIYRLEDSTHVLVTAGHNLTGLRPDTGRIIHSRHALPNSLKLKLQATAGRMQWTEVDVPLGDSAGKALWWEDPQLGRTIDVVALPLPPEINVVNPINRVEAFDFQLRPSLDVFILGYPLDISGGGNLPVWKRGTIASEPAMNIDGHPKMLVDTASRPGMSGAIVIAQNSGVVMRPNPGGNGVDMISAARQLLGVYSGRVDDLAEAQLGIIWKWSAVLQIIGARKRANNDVPANPPN